MTSFCVLISRQSSSSSSIVIIVLLLLLLLLLLCCCYYYYCCYTIHNTKIKTLATNLRPILRLVSNTAALPSAVHQWHHAFYPCVGNAICKHNEQNAQQDHNRQSSITLGLVCESTVGYGTYHAGSRPLQVTTCCVSLPFYSRDTTRLRANRLAGMQRTRWVADNVLCGK